MFLCVGLLGSVGWRARAERRRSTPVPSAVQLLLL
jgi:hypothetical protein